MIPAPLKTIVIKEKNFDLNNLFEEGRYYFYYDNPPVNAPEGITQGWLEVFSSDTAPRMQIWYDDLGDVYIRTNTKETWYDWQKIASEETIDLTNKIKFEGTTLNAGGVFKKGNQIIVQMNIKIKESGWKLLFTLPSECIPVVGMTAEAPNFVLDNTSAGGHFWLSSFGDNAGNVTGQVNAGDDIIVYSNWLVEN